MEKLLNINSKNDWEQQNEPTFILLIMYHKRFGKDGLIAQVVWSNQPVRESARRDLKEHQEAAPSHCSLLVSLRLLVPLLPDGYEGLPQDYCFASTDARRLSIPAACLVSPATAHATEQIPGTKQVRILRLIKS